MKFHAKTFPLLGFLWLLPFIGYSQMSVSFLAGATSYFGDIAKDVTNLSETHVAFGGGLGYRLTPKLDLKGHLLWTTLSGDDANYPSRVNRGFKFESEVIELAGILEYYILGSSIRTKTGVFEPSGTPFVFAGLGASKIKNDVECYTCMQGESPFPEEGFKSTLFTLPFGVGYKYDATPLMAMGLRAGYRYSFSDYLDGVSTSGNAAKNDWYFTIGANMTFYFGKSKKL